MSATPARIRPLSVLPVFMNLVGKRAVVAGGTDAAAWKAELLVAAGADVHVHAPTSEVSDEMSQFIDRESAVTLHQSVWNAACLRHVAVAVADAADEKEAARFEAAARFLFDDLVSDEVTGVGAPRSEAHPGRQTGRAPECKQHEINETMVRLAKAGRRVVRLKSGDPMIFGRAGEEIESFGARRDRL